MIDVRLIPTDASSEATRAECCPSPFLRALGLECRRAFGGRPFLVCLAIGSVLAVTIAVIEGISARDSMLQAMEYADKSWVAAFSHGAYALWLPMSIMRPLPGPYFLLAPLLAATAYAWSMRSDLDGGYAASILVRTNPSCYYCAKACATFLSGGTVIAVPLALNLTALLCLVPAYQPSVLDVVYTGIWTRVFDSSLYYTHPAAYAVKRLAIDFLLGGLWSTATLGASLLFRSKVTALVAPLLAAITLQSVWTTLRSLLGTASLWSSITILDHLKARGDALYYDGWAVLADVAALLAVSALVPLVKRRRDVL